MKILIRLLTICLIAMVGCDQRISYEEALSENKERFKEPGRLEDALFFVRTKSRSTLAGQVLTLTSDSGYSSVAVGFAKATLSEHQKLDEEIAVLAKKKKILLPDELSPEDQILLSQLTSSSRQEFDNTFNSIITRINEDNNSLFTAKATQASDPDIRAFAARKLDLLRVHSQQLSTMQNQLLNTTKEP